MEHGVCGGKLGRDQGREAVRRAEAQVGVRHEKQARCQGRHAHPHASPAGNAETMPAGGTVLSI